MRVYRVVCSSRVINRGFILGYVFLFWILGCSEFAKAREPKPNPHRRSTCIFSGFSCTEEGVSCISRGVRWTLMIVWGRSTWYLERGQLNPHKRSPCIFSGFSCTWRGASCTLGEVTEKKRQIKKADKRFILSLMQLIRQDSSQFSWPNAQESLGIVWD